MRIAIALLFVIAACAPVSLDTLQEEEVLCTPPEILNGTGCCLDENEDGRCDTAEVIPETPISEPEPERPIIPHYSFEISYGETAPPSNLNPGDTFDIVVQIENNGNIILPADDAYARLIFANPRMLGMKTTSDMRRGVGSSLHPGQNTAVRWEDVTLDPEFDEASTINLEVRFCYITVAPHEECIVTRKLIRID